jgi:hypothetical protein
MIFGLPFIPYEEIEVTFVEAVMSEAPWMHDVQSLLTSPEFRTTVKN